MVLFPDFIEASVVTKACERAIGIAPVATMEEVRELLCSKVGGLVPPDPRATRDPADANWRAVAAMKFKGRVEDSALRGTRGVVLLGRVDRVLRVCEEVHLYA